MEKVMKATLIFCYSKSNLDFLLQFLKGEIGRCERSETFKEISNSKPQVLVE